MSAYNFTDLTGRRFGILTVISRSENHHNGSAMWLCRCDCGAERIMRTSRLTSEGQKSCGCNDLLYIEGKRFGKLIVIGRAPGVGRRGMWLCRCDCGVEKAIDRNSIVRGLTRSCGCGRRLPYGEANFNSLYREYVNNVRGHPFHIDKGAFRVIVLSDCYYCGGKPSGIKSGLNNNGPFVFNGIDRFNNDQEYEIDNIVACCKRCNYLKGSMNGEDFIEICNVISKNHPRDV